MEPKSGETKNKVSTGCGLKTKAVRCPECSLGPHDAFSPSFLAYM